MIKIEINNLIAKMKNMPLNVYQEADALLEFAKLIKYTEDLERKVKNDILLDVSQQRELLESFVDYAKGRSIRDINIDDDTILYFLEDSNCG
jgi:hypothetical protein